MRLSTFISAWLALAVFAAVQGCSDDPGTPGPGGDTGSGMDAATDSGSSDAGPADSVATDSGMTDTGAPDGSGGDTGTADATVPEGGASDTGPVADVGSPDTGPLDTGLPDTGPADTGTSTVCTGAVTDMCPTQMVTLTNRPPGFVMVTGDTTGLADRTAAPCGGVGSGEFTIRLDILRFGFYRVTVNAAFDTVLYVRRACDGPVTACSDLPGSSGEQVNIDIAGPGVYFVIVDGKGQCGPVEVIMQAV